MTLHDTIKYINSINGKAANYIGFLGLFRSLFLREDCRKVTKEVTDALKLGEEMSEMLEDTKPQLSHSLSVATKQLRESWQRMWKAKAKKANRPNT